MATSANHTLETLLNENDVARITGMSVATIRRWRLLKRGPRFLKLSNAVRYTKDEILDWLKSRLSSGEQGNGSHVR